MRIDSLVVLGGYSENIFEKNKNRFNLKPQSVAGNKVFILGPEKTVLVASMLKSFIEKSFQAEMEEYLNEEECYIGNEEIKIRSRVLKVLLR